MSIEPWNTGTGGEADCEDMPRKSIDNGSRMILFYRKGGNCTLFLPSGEDGFGQSPKIGQRAQRERECRGSLVGSQGRALSPQEAFDFNISSFQDSIELIFSALFSQTT